MGHLGTTRGRMLEAARVLRGPQGSGQEPGTPAECRCHRWPIQSSALVPEGLPPGWPQMSKCGGGSQTQALWGLVVPLVWVWDSRAGASEGREASA